MPKLGFTNSDVLGRLPLEFQCFQIVHSVCWNKVPELLF